MRAGFDYIGVGVTGVVFNEQGKLLLAQRGPEARNERGKWEFPGGAVRHGEPLTAALYRELEEEHGISVRIVEPLGFTDNSIPAEGVHWISPSYICELAGGRVSIREPLKCSTVGWFTLAEVEALPLTIATQQNVQLLRRHPRVPRLRD